MPINPASKKLLDDINASHAKGDAEELFSRLSEWAKNIATGRYGRPNEDASQEALMRVWTKMSQFKGKSKFSTWAYEVLLSGMRDYDKHERRLDGRSLDVKLESFDAVDESDPADPAFLDDGFEVDANDRIEIERALARLSVDKRRVVELILQRYSSTEVAAKLGITPQNVRKIWERTLKEVGKG